MIRMSTIPIEPTTLDAVEGDAADLYEAVAQAVEHDPPSERDRGFGAGALKVNGKIFAMLADENLVVKLPRGRVEELIKAGEGAPFDPGHGRVMREWVTVSPVAGVQWIPLAEEARAFVASR
jgi:hypothetical protein